MKPPARNEYEITWKIDIDDINPREAAKWAQSMMRDESSNWVFEVKDKKTNKIVKIDLDDGSEIV